MDDEGRSVRGDDGSPWEFISRASKMRSPSIVVKIIYALLPWSVSLLLARDQEHLGHFTHPSPPQDKITEGHSRLILPLDAGIQRVFIFYDRRK